MRSLADPPRIDAFLRELGRAARGPAKVYLTGGATAVLFGWRESTADIDLTFDPDRDELLRTISTLKDTLQVNVELAAPAHFIPPPPGWEQRCIFIRQEGPLEIYHMDPYAQALSKVERGHTKDQADVREFVARGLVEPARARELFEAIAPQLYRYPAIDPIEFREGVRQAFGA